LTKKHFATLFLPIIVVLLHCPTSRDEEGIVIAAQKQRFTYNAISNYLQKVPYLLTFLCWVL
jgi:preprotein translocase subunit SecG